MAARTRTVEQHARDTALYAVFDAMAVGVAVCLEDGTVVEVNEALLRLLGLSAETCVGSTLDRLLGDELAVARVASADRYERSVSALDGRLLWVRVTTSRVRGADGRTLLLVQSVEDVTELRAREEQLQDRALRDPVTGLPNRYLVQDRLEHALAQRWREGTRLGVVFVDLDGFKRVNDTAGHLVGDQVLREAGRRITETARGADTVARWAGDEFVVVCDGVRDEAAAEALADRITQACSRPYAVGDHVFTLSASAGVALTQPPRWVSAEDLLDAADRAMYARKRAAPS